MPDVIKPRAQKLRRNGVISYVKVPSSTTYETRHQPTQSELATMQSDLNTGVFAGYASWDVIPNNTGGGNNTGNYTGAIKSGGQSDTTVLNVQATSINLNARSFFASNAVNFQPDPGQTVQSLINSQGFENGPIDGTCCIGWPYVFHTWSLNPNVEAQSRRGDQYRRGQSVLTVL